MGGDGEKEAAPCICSSFCLPAGAMGAGLTGFLREGVLLVELALVLAPEGGGGARRVGVVGVVFPEEGVAEDVELALCRCCFPFAFCCRFWKSSMAWCSVAIHSWRSYLWDQTVDSHKSVY